MKTAGYVYTPRHSHCFRASVSHNVVLEHDGYAVYIPVYIFIGWRLLSPLYWNVNVDQSVRGSIFSHMIVTQSCSKTEKTIGDNDSLS